MNPERFLEGGLRITAFTSIAMRNPPLHGLLAFHGVVADKHAPFLYYYIPSDETMTLNMTAKEIATWYEDEAVAYLAKFTRLLKSVLSQSV